jgi:hypothetical protein
MRCLLTVQTKNAWYREYANVAVEIHEVRAALLFLPDNQKLTVQAMPLTLSRNDLSEKHLNAPDHC